jgi:hypothetical protein
MTKDDALKMALDAVATGGWKEVTEAATLIKEALAQQDAKSHLQAVSDFGQLQEQEPVAWMVYTQDGQSVYVTDNPTDIQEGQRALPLYTGKTT